MVFVSVSNENGLDLVPVFNQVTEVGDNDIHPGIVSSGKAIPASITIISSP